MPEIYGSVQNPTLSKRCPRPVKSATDVGIAPLSRMSSQVKVGGGTRFDPAGDVTLREDLAGIKKRPCPIEAEQAKGLFLRTRWQGERGKIEPKTECPASERL